MTYTVQRPTRPGMACTGHQRRKRRAATTLVTDLHHRPARATPSSMHTRLDRRTGGRTAAVRPARRDRQRQRRRRRGQRAAATTRRSTTPPARPGRVRHEHHDQRGQPRLRRARSTRRCGPTGRSSQAERGYAAPPSDGLTQLDAHHALDRPRPARRRQRRADRPARPARNGDDRRSRSASGDRQRQAIGTAGARRARVRRHAWRRTRRLERVRRAADAPTVQPPACPARSPRLASTYYLSANVREGQRGQDVPRRDRRPALASPWGQAVSAGDCPTASRPTSAPTARCSPATCTRRSPGCSSPATSRPRRRRRGSCSSASSCPTAGCRATRWSTARRRPDTGGDQLDETSYPILMAWQSGLAGDHALYRDHIKQGRGLPRRARPVVRLGAVGGAGRLLAVDDRRRDRRARRGRRIADVNGDAAARPGLPGHRRPLPAHDQGLDGHHHRPVRDEPLLHPAVEERRPERGDHLQPRQRRADRRPARGRRRRLPGADPARRAAAGRPGRARLAAGRRQGRSGPTTPAAPASTATARRRRGTEDGYGDCYVADPTDLHAPTASRGRPATTAPGTCGRCCPASGPSSSCRPATRAGAAALLAAMNDSTSGVGLMPEQAWENPDLAAVAVRHRPDDRLDRLHRTASRPARPRRSPGPQAQYVRLIARPRRRPPAGAARDRHRPLRTPRAAGDAAGDRHRAGRRQPR